MLGQVHVCIHWVCRQLLCLDRFMCAYTEYVDSFMLGQVHVYLMNVDRSFYLLLPSLISSSLPLKPFFPNLFSYFLLHIFIHTYCYSFFLNYIDVIQCIFILGFFLWQSIITVTHHHASLYDAKNWTQGFMHARQAFYQLSDIHSPDYSYGKTRFTGLFGYGCLILLKATKTVSDWGKIWAQDKRLCS